MDVVEVAGLRVGFRRSGAGPCLLLLHGAVSDSRVWRREIESLSDAFTVVAWDAPGCGASSDPPRHFRMPEYAECLGRFVDTVGLERPHVLGHSWGSTLALEMYRQRPSTVSSLVLVGAYAGWAGSLPPVEVEERLRFALRIASGSVGRFEPDSMPGLFSDAMPTDRADELRRIMSEIRPVGTETMARALAEADLRDVLPQISVPTLLLAGEADQRSPLSIARELHASIRGSRLTVMPGLGHECFLESAETFDAEVRSFLSNLRLRGGQRP
ncbi:MAG: alpha/beta hydrolase [Acidimicrobiia bacterium]|jgi:pimeloyl-ACP methyl ester carboxylesterase